MKNNCSISFQDYGSSVLVFVSGNTPEEAYGRWLSMANWGATSLLNGEEPEYVTDNVISCWSTIERLQRYLFNQHIRNMWNNEKFLAQYKGVKGGFSKAAFDLAKIDFDNITKENYRSVNSNFEYYEFGTIIAEKEDDNFPDLCVKRAFTN